MKHQSNAIPKSCPRCAKKDLTEFPTCRFCGTRYDWIRPKIKKSFDTGAFLRSPGGWITFLVLATLVLTPARDMLTAIAVKQVLTKTADTIYETTTELNQNPQDCQALVKRGDAYMVKLQTNRAIIDYTAAINIQPKSANLYCKRALAYEALGKAEDAKRDRKIAAACSH